MQTRFKQCLSHRGSGIVFFTLLLSLLYSNSALTDSYINLFLKKPAVDGFFCVNIYKSKKSS